MSILMRHIASFPGSTQLICMLQNVTDKLWISLGKRLEAQRTANQVMVIDKCRKERAEWSGSKRQFLQLITEFHLFLWVCIQEVLILHGNKKMSNRSTVKNICLWLAWSYYVSVTLKCMTLYAVCRILCMLILKGSSHTVLLLHGSSPYADWQ